MNGDRILEKIKKCLAMAGSCNPHEAEIAWRQAQKLMQEHRLDMQDIDASEANTAKHPYAFITLKNQLTVARKKYVETLSRCKLTTKRRRGEIFAENWVNGVWSTVMRFAEADEAAEKVIKAYFDKNLPAIPTRELESRKVIKRDFQAAYAGYKAGQNTKLHKAVNRDRRRGLNHLH